jgi:hypothetical protein
VFVCMDEDVEIFSAENAVGPHDILVHVVFTEDGTGVPSRGLRATPRS